MQGQIAYKVRVMVFVAKGRARPGILYKAEASERDTFRQCGYELCIIYV
jgi:hypothetical protein